MSAKSDLDRIRIQSTYSTDINKCENILSSYLNKYENEKYPIKLGKETDTSNEYYLSRDLKLTMAMYFASKYMLNFESSHCTPLPRDFCQLPWVDKELKNYSNY